MTDRNQKLRIFFALLGFLTFLIIWGLIFGVHLQELLYEPLITPEQWCQVQPCLTINLFGISITLVQPTSSLIVYFLGFQTLIIGIILSFDRKKQITHFWWSIALILWGLGALFAGTSYQAFSYEIKCAGNSLCIWTSWYEIIYLILSVGSVDAMFIAQLHSSVNNKYRKLFLIYIIGHFLTYSTIILSGAFIPVRFLISFELMVLFLSPNIGFFLVWSIWRYYSKRNRMERNLIIIWISLIFIIGIYFLYYLLGITEILWDGGIWFSENDVLHIGLIIWMFFIYITVKNHVMDLNIKSSKKA
ncbi:MAG: hypothetical protein ACQERB_07445 [Promethearchaeati archaeon]